jgi:hypothetical protein
MNDTEIKTRIEEFKKITAKGAITPETLGQLLEDILNYVDELSEGKFTLMVNVAEDKNRFVTDNECIRLLDAMANNSSIDAVTIKVMYASGSSHTYIATCIKPNFISLHAKAGSCELHVAADGYFAVTGTKLW